MYGRSPLHLVCENTESIEHHDCILYLFENGADANIQDVFGRSALHIAARNGCSQCIQIILDHGARTDLEDSDGNTPLHVSSDHDQTDAMEALIPACCEEHSHSSVESIKEFYFSRKRDEISSCTYGAVKLSNDSSYVSTRSNTLAQNSHYVPRNVGDDRDSISVSATDDNTEIENTELFDFCQFLRVSFLSASSFLFIRWSKLKQNKHESSQQETLTTAIFTEPPDHVREAMERFKQLRHHSGERLVPPSSRRSNN
eukprot:CCRYP_000193-RA/>CCRYP_000193-RA protein AED:0.46 eAED:-0.36 QI:0/0/0/1/0/0/2/0/256